VLLVPLAAMIFNAAGRHPIAGLAAAFAGVSGGYSANLLLGTVDPLLSGLTEEAARIVDPEAVVNPACNYYFMVVSTFMVTFVGAWVTERVVIPRLGAWKAGDPEQAGEGGDELRALSTEERRGLWAALVTALVFAGILVWGTVPADGFLRDPDTGELLRSPFMSGIVAIIFLGGALQALFGVVRLGTLLRFTPHPVMAGLQNAAAALLFLVQLGNVFGFDRSIPFTAVAAHLSEVKPLSVAVALVTFIAMWKARAITTKIPPLLVGIGIGTVLYFGIAAAGFGAHLGPIIGMPLTAESPAPLNHVGDLADAPDIFDLLPLIVLGAFALPLSLPSTRSYAPTS
jgi:MFS superfamily sulfate permease-like transporter